MHATGSMGFTTHRERLSVMGEMIHWNENFFPLFFPKAHSLSRNGETCNQVLVAEGSKVSSPRPTGEGRLFRGGEYVWSAVVQGRACLCIWSPQKLRGGSKLDAINE